MIKHFNCAALSLIDWKMNKISSSLAENLLLYAAIRLKFLEKFPRCAAGLNRCTYYATQVHHKKGRGLYLLVLETWIGVCHNCHERIEGDPKRAKELNLSMDRLTDDVDLIGYKDIINLK